MNIVKTVAPISIENLKKYFTDKSTFYIIDYKNSTIKGTKLLTYLSNLDVPCDIAFDGCDEDECYAMIKEYLNASVIVNVKSLEFVAIGLFKQFKGMIDKFDAEFIEENKDIISSWVSKLDSLTIYNMSIVDVKEFKDFALAHEKDESDSLIGVNFISLLKHPEFYELYKTIDTSGIRYYEKYFNEYMFKGKNMYSYWATDKNPLFLLTVNIANGDINGKEYVEAKKQSIEELENATPIQ